MEIYSLPEYDLILDRANEEDELIPFSYLCEAFPPDEDQAFLAYAQADSLVEYIQNKYGLSGLQSLIYAYDQGVSCERGVEFSLGISLQELEQDWLLDRFNRVTYLILIYVLAAVFVALVIGLWIFLYLKTRKDPVAVEWDENELYT
jgi:hypothetical protein